MKKIKLTLSVTLLLIVVNVLLNATGISFLKTPVGAKAIAFGSAFTAIADDPSAVYWNPAGLAQLQNINIYLSKHLLSLDRSFTFLTVTKSDLLWFDAVSISLIHGSTSKLKQYDINNNFIKEFSDNNIACIFSVAKKISQVYYGGNLKLIYQDILDENSIGLGIDLGLLYTKDKLRLGLVLQDPYTFTKWESGHIDTTPIKLRLGIGYLISNSITVAGNLERTNTTDITKISAGLEAKLPIGLAVRCLIPLDILLPFGTTPTVAFENLFAIGVGFNLWKITLDYTYKVDTFKVFDSHLISLNLRF